MPVTHIKLYPLEAVVIYANGDAHVRPCQTEAQADMWINLKLHQHGTAIVATEIIPTPIVNMCEVKVS